MSLKSTLTACLALVVALLAAACGTDSTATPTPTSPSQSNGGQTPVPTATTPAGQDTATPTATQSGSSDFDAEAYFSGKTIRMMVGFAPGGGTDATARYFASNWPKFIPGNPKISVSNLTPDLVMRNYVWNAKPDGLTLGMQASPCIVDEYEPAAQFKMDEVSFIGSSSGRAGSWTVLGSLGYDCFNSAMGASGPELIIGSNVPSPADLSAGDMMAMLSADRLNMPLKFVNVTQTGTAPTLLMLERGDTNGWNSIGIWQQIPRLRPEWLPSGFLEPFADMSAPGYNLKPNAQMEFGCTKPSTEMSGDDVEIFDTLAAMQSLFLKHVIGPPGIDPDVLATLRQAYEDAINDPEFAEGLVTASSLPIGATFGEEGQQLLQEAVQSYRDFKSVIDELRETLHSKYVR